MQWPKDRKGAIRRRKSKKDRQYNGQKIAKGQSEGVSRRKTDNTMAKRKKDLQSTTQKTKDRAPRTPLKLNVPEG